LIDGCPRREDLLRFQVAQAAIGADGQLCSSQLSLAEKRYVQDIPRPEGEPLLPRRASAGLQRGEMAVGLSSSSGGGRSGGIAVDRTGPELIGQTALKRGE